MKSTPLTAVLAGVLALSAGASAFAQPYSTDPAAEQRYEDRQQD